MIRDFLIWFLTKIYQAIDVRMIKPLMRSKYSYKNATKNLSNDSVKNEIISKNKKFKDIHKGKRCFIVGNAPSLKTQDLSLLKDEIVFTVNYIYKSDQYESLNSNYHFFTDSFCFDLERTNTDTFLSIEKNGVKPALFVPYEMAYEYVKKTKIDEKLDINFISVQVPMELEMTLTELDAPISGYWTVIHTAIVSAIYMGVSEIYLLGCDCTGIVTDVETLQGKEDVSGYNYKFDEKQKEKLLYEYGNNIKFQDTLRSWAYVFDAYDVLNKHCEKIGVKLYNATNGGILRTIERKKFEDLFERGC